MKNKLLVSSFRKIWDTRKKFLSLLCMALLGVGFFAGIKATSPDMSKTLDEYLDNNNVYDVEIVSTLGLTDEDIEEIKKLSIASYITGSRYTDEIIDIENKEKVVRIISLTDINKVILKDGNLPTKTGEIVVEKLFLDDYDLKIGDILNFDSENLKDNEFKIVGVVESPIYFTKYRGTTNIGSGEWNYYFYIQNEAFAIDYYTNIYVTLNAAKDKMTNSESYLSIVESDSKKIEKIKSKREESRYENLYGDAIKKLESLGMEINEDDFQRPTWYIFDRTDNQAYTTFIDATESIKQIGSVFPLVFFIVAILISLISMSRMVEEERCEIGTLKGLGFSNSHLYFKNLLYSFLATSIGGIIGMFIGFNLIPKVIWNIYTSLFFIPEFVSEFSLYYASIGLIIALVCICGASIITTHNILKEKTSNLMRAKAPKIGKKIFLENFKFWDNLRFSTKISIRNVFRYKKRIIVTIIGLAGSTALLLVGFGLKDSVNDVVEFNYNNVFVYDRMIYLKDNYDNDTIMNLLNNNINIGAKVKVSYELINLYNEDKKNLEINLIAPEVKEEIGSVIYLNDINNDKKRIVLPDTGIVLSEKLAKSLNVKVGDKVSFLIDDEYKEIEITYIVENYINDYAYLSKESYESLFNSFKTNVIFLKVTEDYDISFDNILMGTNDIANIITKEASSNLINDILSNLNAVVVILIVASSMLAFVILYNLSSINISERKREISTLKVLGFYDEEVDAYITNENYFITVVGIIIGLIFGLYLCHYVISTCEPQFVMFVRHIKIPSYIISAIISGLFTFIVSKITHFNLKKIDMVESLKSNE